MKTLKEFGLAIIAFIACISMVACSNDNGIPEHEDEQEIYTVKLGWGGELDVTYEPLSRVTTNDLYGIQVYSSPDKELEEGEKVEWTKYAYGLFDDKDKMNISLLKGYKYKFIATMVVDGKAKIQGNNNKYSFPFYLSGDESQYAVNSNEFVYKSSTYFGALLSGLTNLVGIYNSVNHPNTERFYGELDNYIPSKNNEKAKIHMKRTSFGAKFIANGKAAEAIGSKLEIQITDAPKMELTIENNNKQISDIFTFSNVHDAWAEGGNYTEIIKVNIIWHRTDGTTVPLGTHDITYKRNATTVVKVSVVNDTSSEGVGVELETTAITESSEYDTEIEDGVIIDTKVDTNK